MSFVFVDAEDSNCFRWVVFNKKFEKIEAGKFTGEEDLKSKAKIDGIFLGIPRHFFVAKEIELPPLSYENVKEALSYRIPKLFYFIKQPFFVFFALRDDFSKVLVFVCEKKEIDDLISKVERLFESKVVAVFFSAMAMAGFLRTQYDSFVFKLPRQEGFEAVIVAEGRLKSYFFIASENHLPQHQLFPEIRQRFVWHWEEEALVPQETAVGVSAEFFSYMYITLKKVSDPQALLFNFFPERIKFLKEESLFQRLTVYLFVASFIFLVASPLVRLSKEVHYLEKKTAALAPEVKRLKELGKEIDKKSQELQTILAYFKFHAVDILAQISSVLPKDVNIEYIRLHKDTLRLMGYAPKAADVLTALSKIKAFKQAKFSGPIVKRRVDNKEMERFTLEVKIAPSP